MPLNDVESLLDSGDLILVPNGRDAAMVVRPTQSSDVLVWDGATDTLQPMSEYAQRCQTRVLHARLLVVGSTRRRALLRRGVDALLRRQWSPAARVAVDAIVAAGGTWAVPRSHDYCEQDIALMRAASPAYALVDAYIRLALVDVCKSANLYDWHDLTGAGDLQTSLVADCRLTRTVVIRTTLRR